MSPMNARFAVALVCLVSLSTTAARAESTYCRKVRARGMGDAALLFAPSLQLQGIHFPANGAIDTGTTTGSGYQFRAAIAWSPLDFYKGFRVMRVADADCSQHDATATANEVLSSATDYGRLPALRKEAAFLDQKKVAWDEVVQKSEERLSAGVSTLLDTNLLRGKVAELERKRAQTSADIQRLEAIGAPEHVAVSALIASIDQKARAFEREASHVRSLDAWTVSVVAGLVPQDNPVDYFGIIQLSYNFGGFARNAGETRYLAARSEELKKARYELEDQLERFRAQARIANTGATRELGILDREKSTFDLARQTLAGSDAPNTPHALAVIDLELIGIEADRIYLTTYASELAALGDKT